MAHFRESHLSKSIHDTSSHWHQAPAPTPTYVDDSERLILDCFDAIHDSPSHIYHTALPLSPSSSWIRKFYKAEVDGEVRVLVGLPDQWDTCSRTIHLGGSTKASAYGGDMIAVGLRSNVVLLLDAVTGRRTSALRGHKDDIHSLAFSLDATLLVSRDHNTVNLWDVQTGGVIRAFDDYTSATSAVSISPDGTTIALGTSDGAIRLWDVRTGRCCSIERHQDGEVTVIRFSPVDSRRLLSSSCDRTVQQWDVGGHQIGSSLREADDVEDLAYSSDGTCFVSCGGRVVTVRDSESGVLVVKIRASHFVRRCCFSPDGRFIACAAEKTILFWDITIPGAPLVGHLVGHSNPISFLAFPSSLISGSEDQTMKFWQTSSLLADSTATDQMVAPEPITSLKLFAGERTVVTYHHHGVVKTWDLATGRLKSSFSTPAQGVQDTHLAGDTLIMVWYMEGEAGYRIWDVYKGQPLRKLSSTALVYDIKISGDGSKIFGLCAHGIQAVSMQTGKVVGHVDLWASREERLIVDGFTVGIKNANRNRGWDFGGPKVSDLGEFSAQPRLRVVGWSPGRRVSNPCWIKDIETGRLVFRFPAERYMKKGTEIEWHGRYLLVWTLSPENWPLSAVGLVIMDFDPVWPQ